MCCGLLADRFGYADDLSASATAYACQSAMIAIFNDAVDGASIAVNKTTRWHFAGSYQQGRGYTAHEQSMLGLAQLKFQIDPDHQQIVTPNSVRRVPALQFMGQSWSKPTLSYVNWQGQRKLVMLVGGGFDANGAVNCVDPRLNHQGYHCPTYDPKWAAGAGIYMFDAANGDLLWWTSAQASTSLGAQTATWHRDLKYSVVSQINSIDRDGDGLSDAFYFADLGGQIFRVDLNNLENDSSKLVHAVVRIFDAHQDRGLSPRFYRMPSFSVHAKQSDQNLYGMVALTSGNANSPHLEGASLSAQDGVFVIYDQDIVRDDLYRSRQLTSVDISVSKLTRFSADLNTPLGRTEQQRWGWWYPFSPRIEDAGKIKGLGDVRVIDHHLYVHVYHQVEQVNAAAVDPCTQVPGNMGRSYLYQFCLPGGRCADSMQATGVRQQLLGTGLIKNAFVLVTEQGQSYLRLQPSPTAFGGCDTRGNPDRLECLQFNFIRRMQTLRWFEQRAE